MADQRQGMYDTDSMTRWFVTMFLVLTLGIGGVVLGWGQGHPTLGERVVQASQQANADLSSRVRQLGH